MNRIAKGSQDIRGHTRPWSRSLSITAALVLLVSFSPAQAARDAAFLDPNAGTSGSSDDAIRVEPKSEIDIGDSSIGVARRVDLFFVNQSGVPVKIEKMAINGDGNVSTEITTDDCSKQGTISPGSRCNVGVSITPTSPGPWSAEALLTHNGAGRLTRAKLSGKTGGSAAGDKKDTGLSLSTKEINPVNFGDVDPSSGGKVVRSALMVNDSPEPITLYSIDVIEASNGLQRLDQGCAVDMELKAGESCPVTLVWTPTSAGQISTDLIIRHSGRLGFAVVPIRGTAKGVVSASADAGKSNNTSGSSSNNVSGSKTGLPNPPSATDLAKAVDGKIPALSAAALGAAGSSVKPVSEGRLSLIGTVGTRGLFVKPDGDTAVAAPAKTIDLGDREVKVLGVDSKSATVVVDGKKKTLVLEASASLIAKASAASSKNKDKDKEAKETMPADNGPPATPMGASTAPSGGSPAGTSPLWRGWRHAVGRHAK